VAEWVCDLAHRIGARKISKAILKYTNTQRSVGELELGPHGHERGYHLECRRLAPCPASLYPAWYQRHSVTNSVLRAAGWPRHHCRHRSDFQDVQRADGEHLRFTAMRIPAKSPALHTRRGRVVHDDLRSELCSSPHHVCLAAGGSTEWTWEVSVLAEEGNRVHQCGDAKAQEQRGTIFWKEEEQMWIRIAPCSRAGGCVVGYGDTIPWIIG